MYSWTNLVAALTGHLDEIEALGFRMLIESGDTEVDGDSFHLRCSFDLLGQPRIPDHCSRHIHCIHLPGCPQRSRHTRARVVRRQCLENHCLPHTKFGFLLPYTDQLVFKRLDEYFLATHSRTLSNTRCLSSRAHKTSPRAGAEEQPIRAGHFLMSKEDSQRADTHDPGQQNRREDGYLETVFSTESEMVIGVGDGEEPYLSSAAETTASFYGR